MRGVAARRQRPQQAVELKKIGFMTLHRKAPFEYLRDRQIHGQPRRRLVCALFGTQEYTQTILREHTAYLSSAASFYCTDSLCGDLMRDTAFSEALDHYQTAYNEYYRAYCDSLLAEQAGETSPVESLLPYLRYQLKLIREHMLAGAPEQSEFAKLQSLYHSLGDTQKLAGTAAAIVRSCQTACRYRCSPLPGSSHDFGLPHSAAIYAEALQIFSVRSKDAAATC